MTTPDPPIAPRHPSLGPPRPAVGAPGASWRPGTTAADPGDTDVIGAVGADDWPGIAALEASAYDAAGLTEGPATLQTRAAPGTSFVARTGGRITGYVLALAYPRFRAPDLAQPSTPGTSGGADLHLHDLVVAPGQRGRGLATRLHAHLVAAAARNAYERISLIAVGSSDRFWTARGYRALPHVPVPASYGAAAVYMSRGVEPVAGHR